MVKYINIFYYNIILTRFTYLFSYIKVIDALIHKVTVTTLFRLLIRRHRRSTYWVKAKRSLVELLFISFLSTFN